MTVSEKNLSSNFEIATPVVFSMPLRLVSGFISYVLHPLFIPMYVALFMLFIHPDAFSGFSTESRLQVAFIVLINVVLFPLIAVLLLKALGFIDSIFLRKQKDRIIPYIASGIFFFWAYNVFRQQPQYPAMWVSFLLGLFLASSAALIANIYFKVSMHAIGVGGLTAFIICLIISGQMPMAWPLAIALLLTGMVSSSRLILQAHHPFDIYGGLIVGMFAQFAAYIITF